MTVPAYLAVRELEVGLANSLIAYVIHWILAFHSSACHFSLTCQLQRRNCGQEQRGLFASFTQNIPLPLPLPLGNSTGRSASTRTSPCSGDGGDFIADSAITTHTGSDKNPSPQPEHHAETTNPRVDMGSVLTRHRQCPHPRSIESRLYQIRNLNHRLRHDDLLLRQSKRPNPRPPARPLRLRPLLLLVGSWRHVRIPNQLLAVHRRLQLQRRRLPSATLPNRARPELQSTQPILRYGRRRPTLLGLFRPRRRRGKFPEPPGRPTLVACSCSSRLQLPSQTVGQ
jgi:hypothetical protein